MQGYRQDVPHGHEVGA